VVVTGTGVVSPLGNSRGSLHEGLCAGQIALKSVRGFDTPGIEPPLAGEIADFDPVSYLGARNLRALNRIAQLLSTAAKLALVDSGWNAEMLVERGVGLVAGTMFCSAHTISQFDLRALREGPAHASPLDFANTVINAASGQAAIWHNLWGLNSTISAGSTSGLQAVSYAVDMIRHGHVDAVLSGGVEELAYETLFAFYHSGALCNSPGKVNPMPIPFDKRRNGFFLSEGAALVMLEEAKSAAARGAKILAEIKGHGSAFDCHSRSEPNGSDTSHAKTIARSMRSALRDADLTIDDVQAISASANGGPTDAAEAVALAEMSGDGTEGVPVTAIKRMLGEGLGAGGAMQTVDLIETLRDGRLPGIVGLEEPLMASLGSLSCNTRKLKIENVLINSVGLDGHCCALVLGRGRSTDRGRNEL
jgi:3-oxoacyl-[acyl-carrier-protein] synthase II